MKSAMYRYNFVFYSQRRLPVSSVVMYAMSKPEALAQAKKHIDGNVRGYTMQSMKVTREFCLDEIVKNGDYVRIGACILSFLCDGTIEVCDWDGNKSYFTDLLPAIDAFIASVNNVG